MKLYLYRFRFRTSMATTSQVYWDNDVSFIHIVAKNKIEAREAAKNRFNRYLNKNWSKKLYNREILDVAHVDSAHIYSDGFLNIYT